VRIKSDGSTKDCICEELGRVYDQFSRCDTTVLLDDFNTKVGREDIFKPTIGNESPHEISDDNVVRVINLATSKNLVVKSTMFHHRDICKYTWTSPGGETQNEIYYVLIGDGIRVHLMSDLSEELIAMMITIW
jgi:hypothetical protein